MEELKKIFEKVVINNESYYNTFECDNGKFIIILKYPYTNFEMKVLSSRNSNHVEEFYNSLGSFDCFDMLRETLAANSNN